MTCTRICKAEILDAIECKEAPSFLGVKKCIGPFFDDFSVFAYTNGLVMTIMDGHFVEGFAIVFYASEDNICPRRDVHWNN